MWCPTTRAAALAGLTGALIGWGLWPTLRMRCKLSVAGFAVVNATSQLFWGLIYASTLGEIAVSDSGMGSRSFWDDMLSTWHNFDVQVGVNMLGGFLLGHGDHAGSLSMQYIPPGVAYPLYAGVAILLGTTFNLIQEPPKSPLLFVGLALVLMGLVFLTLTQALWEKHQTSLKVKASIQAEESDVNYDAKEPLLDPVDGDVEDGQDLKHSDDRDNSLAARGGWKLMVGVCLIAGMCGACWSPLGTFAHKKAPGQNAPLDNPYVSVHFFQLGQILSLPSVTFLGGKLSGESAYKALSGVKSWRTIFWGSLCGLAVCTGYIAYFSATSSLLVPSTATFCIVSCNPLLAMLMDVFIARSLKGAPAKVWACVAISLLSYGAAIVLLAMAS